MSHSPTFTISYVSPYFWNITLHFAMMFANEASSWCSFFAVP